MILSNLLNFFITPAAAADVTATAPNAQQGGTLSLFVMLAVFIVFMYFVVWRPQNKRAKEQRDLLGSLNKGDEVLTAGGIVGKISKVTDHYVVLALADNVEITIQKSSIVGALPKGTLKSI